VPAIRQTADIVQTVSAASLDQARELGMVTEAMRQVDEVTRRNAASAQELAAMAQEMFAQSESMQTIVSVFRVAEEQRPRHEAPVPIAAAARRANVAPPRAPQSAQHERKRSRPSPV
jgi:methyl-accepting chemotaxis protein